MTGQVIHLCQASVATGLHHAGCRYRARWWACNVGAFLAEATPTCGTHSRTFRSRWPILTEDPQADRLTMEDTFR